MKIRNGFVSNSSSSSFVVLTTPQNLQNIIDNSSDDFKEFIKKTITESRWRKPKTIKVHGMDLVDLSRVIHDSYIDGWDDEEHGRGDITGYDLWTQLTEEVEKGGGYVAQEGC